MKTTAPRTAETKPPCDRCGGSGLSSYGRNMVFGEWKDWAGGICPVEPYERPEVRYRSRGETEVQAGTTRWTHTGAWDDILAYRRRRPVAPGLAP